MSAICPNCQHRMTMLLDPDDPNSHYGCMDCGLKFHPFRLTHQDLHKLEVRMKYRSEAQRAYEAGIVLPVRRDLGDY